MARLPTSVLAILLPLGALAAQEEKDPEVIKREQLEQAGEFVDEGGDAARVDGATKPPESVNAERGGLDRMATPIASFRPRRIPAGGLGEMVVVLSMQGDSVLTPAGWFDVRLPERSGPVLFTGPAEQSPAVPAHYTEAFAGQLVWDNTMTLRIPIRVADDTPDGRYPVSFALGAEVFDGRYGSSRGRYVASVTAQLQVGPPIPTPEPRAASQGGDDVGHRETSVARAGTDLEPDDAPGAPAVAGARMSAGGRGEDAATPSGDDDALPVRPVDSGVPNLVLIGGGAVLALVLVLLLARKR
ncbi:MAG: hypothetical protein IPM29_08580 [Planctomycetes bacterium]|nr:hypothetical protein [Planctomycetota bacterium]